MSATGTGDADDGVPEPRSALNRTARSAKAEHMPGNRRAVSAVIAAFGLLALACAIAGILAWQDIRATEAVADAREARRQATAAFEAVLGAESEQRGYLLTHDPAYLGRYDDLKAGVARALSELRALSAGRPTRMVLTTEADHIANSKFAELDRTIVLGKTGQFDDALALVRTGAGKALMDELRRTVDELAADANGEAEHASLAQSWLGTLLLGTIIVALLCAGALGTMLLRNTRLHLALLAARETSAQYLAAVLERRVAERTRELAAVNERFDAALRASGVTVMTQDRDLVFTWISRGVFGLSAREVIGKPQHEVVPEVTPGISKTIKRGVIETGEPARGDIRVMDNGDETWFDLTVHPLRDEQGCITGVIAGAVNITRYKEQEARIRLLMRELTHRSKNLLSVILAIMRQTASNSVSIEDFDTRFSARLHSLAGSHDLLVREDWQGASMGELVRSQLGHYGDQVDSRIEMSGDPLRVPPDAAQHIGMALHELATNAAKYGALSAPGGKVRIGWHVSPAVDGTPMCHLSWEESGGPPVERPAHRGFGRVVIERTVARALRGEVRIDYAAEGLRWELVFPRSLIADLPG